MQTELLNLKSELSNIKSLIRDSKNYTQEKIIQLLQSETLCSAVKSCKRKKSKLSVDEITDALFTETGSQSTPTNSTEKRTSSGEGTR